MPVFEVKYKSEKDPLEEREHMWVEVLDRILVDENLRSFYFQKAKERARDFSLEKIVKEWKEVV